MVDVSVIIPVRDEAKGIEALLDDLLGQTRPPREILVVDTGSRDDTVARVQAVARRDDRVCMLTAPGALPGGGRNVGLDAAHGEWVAFVDGGIRVAHDWLAQLMAPVDAGRAVDVVLGNMEPVVETRGERISAQAFAPTRRPSPEGAGQWRGYCLPSSAVRTQLARAIRFPAELRASEDLIFYRQLLKHARLAWAPGAMVHWQLADTPQKVWRRFRTYAEHTFRGGLMHDWFTPVARRYLMLALMTGPALPAATALFLLARAFVQQRRKPEFVSPSLLARATELGEVAICLGLIDVATFTAWIAWRRQGRPVITVAPVADMNDAGTPGDQCRGASARG
jgi:glycosyltransferase involved in cell wall biosynthesis